MIFPEPDDHTLNYLEDDSQMVEPEFYMPIIPMILVNGSKLKIFYNLFILNYTNKRKPFFNNIM